MTYIEERKWALKFGTCIRCHKNERTAETIHCPECLDYFDRRYVAKKSAAVEASRVSAGFLESSYL